MSAPNPGPNRVVRVFDLPAGYAELRAESVAEGYGHLQRLEVDWADGTNRFDEPGEALFAAFVGDTLAGVGGISRDPHTGDLQTGRIRRLYISPSHRRSGLGRLLVEHALASAGGHFRAVRVRTPDSTAAAFYKTLRFSRTSSDTATHQLDAPFG
ncbi:MAG: GNAT family N-acetyltransferase [bacterium]|nr:GNAT family N-acetyltransferase [bacterium]